MWHFDQMRRTSAIWHLHTFCWRLLSASSPVGKAVEAPRLTGTHLRVQTLTHTRIPLRCVYGGCRKGPGAAPAPEKKKRCSTPETSDPSGPFGKSIYFQHNWDVNFNFSENCLCSAPACSPPLLARPQAQVPCSYGLLSQATSASTGSTSFVGALILTGTVDHRLKALPKQKNRGIFDYFCLGKTHVRPAWRPSPTCGLPLGGLVQA